MKISTRWRPLLAALALLFTGGVASMPAMAASVTPVSYPGNFTDCDDLPGVGNWAGGGFSTGSAPISGQPYDLGGGQSVTFTYSLTDPKFINFTSTIPLDYVAIKGGNNYNLYHYVPPEDADTDLTSPPTNGNTVGVSHVVVCFMPKPTGEKTATASWKRYTDWNVVKTVTPDTINMFDGDSHDVQYTVTATPTTRGEYRVAGTITVRDPFDFGWNATAVVDTMVFSGNPTQFSKQWDGAGGEADSMSCSEPAGNPDHVILSCSYEFLLSSNSYPFLLSATGGSNGVGITATRQGEDYTFSASANFAIPANPSESYGDSFSINDSMLPDNPDHVFQLGGNYVWQYPRTFTCDQHSGQHSNTASGSWSTGPNTNGTANDSAMVTVNCKTVTVTKDATTRYERRYAWDPEKWIVMSDADAKVIGKENCEALAIASGTYAGSYACHNAALQLNPGDSYDTVYRIDATRTIEDDFAFTVSGNINVTWPSGTPHFDPAAPSDTLTFTDDNSTQPVVPTCDPQGATSLHCTYSAALPRDLVPGYNSASIRRVKKCYDWQGNATDCGFQTYNSNQAALVYGNPAAEHNACTNLSDLYNSVLGQNGGLGFGFSLGQECASFSEYYTGDQLPLDPDLGNLDIFAAWILPGQVDDHSCEFVVPNKLLLSFGEQTTLDSMTVASVNVPLLCVQSGCTYTQGYWKTHVNYAAKPQFSKKRDAAWDLIDGAGAANENAIFFLSGQSYINVMWTPPKGNAYYNLAHQYIAAKLNTLDGASDAAVAADIAQAEAWFSAYAPNVGFWKKNQNVITLAGRLAAYNEGDIGPGHCSVSPATLNAAQ